jgi:hypothetical protein
MMILLISYFIFHTGMEKNYKKYPNQDTELKYRVTQRNGK